MVKKLRGKLKTKGHSKLISMEVGYFKCSKCNHLFESCRTSKNGDSICPKCKNHSHEFEIIIIKEKGAVCSECGTKISLTGDNKLNDNWYLCYKCLNMIAITYKNKIFQPLALLKRFFNQENIKKGNKTCDNLTLVLCNDRKLMKY